MRGPPLQFASTPSQIRYPASFHLHACINPRVVFCEVQCANVLEYMVLVPNPVPTLCIPPACYDSVMHGCYHAAPAGRLRTFKPASQSATTHVCSNAILKPIALAHNLSLQPCTEDFGFWELLISAVRVTTARATLSTRKSAMWIASCSQWMERCLHLAPDQPYCSPSGTSSP